MTTWWASVFSDAISPAILPILEHYDLSYLIHLQDFNSSLSFFMDISISFTRKHLEGHGFENVGGRKNHIVYEWFICIILAINSSLCFHLSTLLLLI